MTQIEVLKQHFKRKKSITQRDAFAELGIMRLSQRIIELEHAGYAFLHRRVKVASRYGSAFITQYVLLKSA